MHNWYCTFAQIVHIPPVDAIRSTLAGRGDDVGTRCTNATRADAGVVSHPEEAHLSGQDLRPLPGRAAALSTLATREAAERRVRIIAFMDRTDRALGLTRRTLFCAAL